MADLCISVVIPTYNAAGFLSECLSSIVKQKYQNIEVIIVDGQSTDSTVKVVEKYSSVITEFISKRDNGQPDAVTKGLKLATGDIVHWHAADDIVLPGAFHRVAKEFNKNADLDLVFSDGLAFDDTNVYRSPTYRWEKFWTTLLFFGRFQSDSAYWRREITSHALPLDTNKPLMCDEDFFLRMWTGRNFKWINQCLGAFRIHSNQISNQVDCSNLSKDRADSRQKVIDRIKMSDTEIQRLRRKYFLQYYLLNRFAVKAYSAARYMVRKLTFDIARKRYNNWFFNEWLKTIY